MRCRRGTGGRPHRDRDQDRGENDDQRHHRAENGDRRAVERGMRSGGGNGGGGRRGLGDHRKLCVGVFVNPGSGGTSRGAVGASPRWRQEFCRTFGPRQKHKSGRLQAAPLGRLSSSGKTTYAGAERGAKPRATGSSRAPPVTRAGCNVFSFRLELPIFALRPLRQPPPGVLTWLAWVPRSSS